jgi:hypothetical protein
VHHAGDGMKLEDYDVDMSTVGILKALPLLVPLPPNTPDSTRIVRRAPDSMRCPVWRWERERRAREMVHVRWCPRVSASGLRDALATVVGEWRGR